MPQASYDWQVYNLDAVEDAIVQILRGPLANVYGRRSTENQTTPCVAVILQVGTPEGKRFIRFPENKNAIVQPLNTWNFELKAQVITNRTNNGDQHGTICGKVRALLQYAWLTLTFTESVAPYHSITDIRESGAPSDFIDDDNLDVTELTFTGMLNIRDNAWPAQLS